MSTNAGTSRMYIPQMADSAYPQAYRKPEVPFSTMSQLLRPSPYLRCHLKGWEEGEESKKLSKHITECIIVPTETVYIIGSYYIYVKLD